MEQDYQIRSDSWLGRILVYNSLPSTNSHIIQHLSQFRHLDVVVAHQQTAGRGRHARKWESSKKKSLTFSLVFDLSKLPKLTNCHRDIHTLPQVLALALVEFLELFEVSATLKWPNDILIKKKKLAGILSEIQTSYRSPNSIDLTTSTEQAKLIIGIGVNLNHSAEELNLHPFEATSLKASRSIKSVTPNKDTPPLLFLERYLNFSIPFLNLWTEEGFNFFINKYKKHCDLLGKTVQIKQGSQILTMKVKDLNSEGFLKVKGPNGNQLLTFGEIIT